MIHYRPEALPSAPHIRHIDRLQKLLVRVLASRQRAIQGAYDLAAILRERDRAALEQLEQYAYFDRKLAGARNQAFVAQQVNEMHETVLREVLTPEQWEAHQRGVELIRRLYEQRPV